MLYCLHCPTLNKVFLLLLLLTTLLILELVYNWVGTGDEYDPSGFNLFENGLIRPNKTVEQCVAMIDHPSTNTGLWNMASCDQPAAYVCELPLGKLAY